MEKFIKSNLIKLFLTLVVLLMMSISSEKTFAAMPDISAGQTYFDFKSGCYVLKNNVRVVARGRTMTANEAKVQIASQKVWANGDVSLEQEGFSFKCDSIFVQGKLKTVDVLGSVYFVQDNVITITSSVGQFSWDNKVADFYGQVKVNVAKKAKINFDDNLNIDENNINGVYDHVQYNIRESKIILLDKKYDPIPNITFPEPDPTEGN